ncbi:hypothetical protein PVAG01_09149 [Phlyctema vagabunda]|uniref:Fe2OG dioxygenase domain-containing protein n=1 Tax=Phlyctema vagabunda TaxID=108571 RepID=A0ABR4P6K6_9HELO
MPSDHTSIMDSLQIPQSETQAVNGPKPGHSQESSDLTYLTMNDSQNSPEDEASLTVTSPLTSFYSDSERSSVYVRKPKLIVKLKIKVIESKLNTSKPQRQIWGLTNITVPEGDARSQPAPGPELEILVEVAKSQGLVPRVCDTHVLRFIDGKWMAPQMCNRCQQNGKGGCDRKYPCSHCTNTGAVCESGGYLTILRPTRAVKANTPSLIAGAAGGSEVLPPIASTGENYGLPSNTPSNAQVQSVGKLRRSSRTLTTQKSGETESLAERHANQDDGTANAQTSPEPNQGRKRKSQNDGDFNMTSTPRNGPVRKAARRSNATAVARVTKQSKPDPVDVQEGLPEPFGQPPVWADKRQQLCETLPYYRAYQSGSYMTAGKVFGFMMNKFIGRRDRFGNEVIISRCGGGKDADENGNMIQTRDQDTSAIARALERSMKEKQAVALIAGSGCPISPTKMPHYYNVLDWFHVTDVWCEMSQGLKVWKVRFEKINLAELSWWAPKNSPAIPQDRDIVSTKTPLRACLRCGKIYRKMYNAGWVCLNTGCVRYFEFEGPSDDDTTDYDEAFLNERTRFEGTVPSSISPLPLTNSDLDEMDAFGIEKECKRGIVCQKCRCCTRRIDWRVWSCENPACDYTYQIRQTPIPIEEVVARSLKKSKRFIMRGGIRVSQMTLTQYDVIEYSIPGVDGDENSIGFIRHFKANGIINKQPDGPNDLFIQMQEQDFGLKRNPVRLSGHSQEVLTSHWAANWGAPYKFGVSVLSKGFDAAPPVILKALQRLTWAGQQALGENMEKFHPFNELLSIGYFEDTKISWHDDGEKELGPTVATLSLGADATMSFRPKKKSNVCGPPKTSNEGEKPTVLKIKLGHGDLLIMHGTQIQKLYDHMVEPNGKLRFALTCRYIRPETIADAEERQSAMIKGSLPPGSEQYAYDGDINAKDTMPDDEQRDDVNLDFNRLLARFHTGDVDEATLHDWIGRLSSASSKGESSK